MERTWFRAIAPHATCWLLVGVLLSCVGCSSPVATDRPDQQVLVGADGPLDQDPDAVVPSRSVADAQQPAAPAARVDLSNRGDFPTADLSFVYVVLEEDRDAFRLLIRGSGSSVKTGWMRTRRNYVVCGRTGGMLGAVEDLDSLARGRGRRVLSETGGPHCVRQIDDLNGDGTDDFVVRHAGVAMSAHTSIILGALGLVCAFFLSLLRIRRSSRFGQVLDLVGHMFPRTFREEAWTPRARLLEADFRVRLEHNRASLARVWINLWLSVHITLLVVQCWRTWSLTKIGELTPDRLQRWWKN